VPEINITNPNQFAAIKYDINYKKFKYNAFIISVHVYEHIWPLREEYRGFHTKNGEMVLHFGIAFRPLFTQKNTNNFPAAWVKKFNLRRWFLIRNY
jgi:hypothetical protein